MEGPLLLNELTAFGGNSSVWTCFICVLRHQSLALYTPIIDGSEDNSESRIAGAGPTPQSVGGPLAA
jgi:hypothetical protein